MALKLLQTHQITFTRFTDSPYVDEDGEVVQGSTTETIDTCGSLQPFSEKQRRVGLPEGFREEDYWVYYTTADLRTIEQFDNLIPDRCTIDRKVYKVLKKGDWNDFGLLADNNEYYLQLVQPKGS